MKQTILLILLLTCHSGFSQKIIFDYPIDEGFEIPDSIQHIILRKGVSAFPNSTSKHTGLKTAEFYSVPSDFDFQAAFLFLKQAASIEKVIFRFGDFDKLPSGLQLLDKLHSVEIIGCPNLGLEQVIAILKKVKGLDALRLSGTSSKFLPESIAELNISELNLSVNYDMDMKQAMECIARLPLTSLDVSDTRLGAFPKALLKLKKLKYLNIMLTGGKFNSEEGYRILSKMKMLRELDIQGNFIRKLDANYIKLKKSKLKILRIGGNCLPDDDIKRLKSLSPDLKVEFQHNC